MTSCAIASGPGGPCPMPVEPAAPIPLCAAHLLEAHDWVTRDVGVTDLLPSPCLACGSRLGVRYPSGWLCATCEWRVGDLAEPENTAAVRVDVVYYLRFRDQVKIGTSANPRRRLASLRYDELLAFEPGDRSVEQRRHAQFGHFRLARSEWFAVHPALMRHIDVVSAGVDDPWSRYALWRSQRLALLA